MNYDLSSLTTVAGCDELINVAGNEKAGLIARRIGVERRIQANQSTGVLESKIAFLDLRIQSNETLLAAAQNPVDEASLKVQIGEFIRQRGNLAKRLHSIGTYYLVTRQTDLGELDARIAFWDDVIDQIEAHKATLSAAPESDAA